MGSGKSTVAQLLAQRGWHIVDADQIAREIVEPGQPALAELASAFGADVLNDDGSLNRSLLAQRAFASEEGTAALNAITHPRIAERTEQAFAQARAAGVQWCVYDMPLLVEQGRDKDMDAVIVVDVGVEERLRRLVQHRGVDEADARRRIAAQIPDQQRLAAATHIIDNTGSKQQLEAAVGVVAADIEASAR